MHLYNDENIRFARPHFPSSVKEAIHSTSRPLPLKNEGSLAGISDTKCILRQGNYSICLANSPRQCSLVNKLVKSMYSWRGYHTEGSAISSHNPNQLTLEASIGQDLAGTLTIGVDSKEGLLVDTLYEQELKTLRAKDRKVCELSKLAIDPVHSSKELLASLFNLAYIYGRIVRKATDFVIEINPRHKGYYKRILGFRQIGETRTCQRVNAPAVLLHLELDYVDTQILSLAGSPDPRQRSLYAYFLTKTEEHRVANNLMRHSLATH
ncbi:N-acyl amino acid synthase FeeM domain-containing protein [Nitrosovibrio sp. Nv4]|uniref:N-acyl amino acid synthase FeeM domain-containing protein n=1 Tax=Nitrosovibrio sp. Nv4 TaxID=1945880 RepID=UPI000BCB1712|nr:long-chain N-acyl amino acid synthase [Nitrosovibrio sp. Nv4]SOD40592.1 hypothetical protein SAMN06298226_0866 [Nitrosovibrio sp. Nv4]